MSYVKTALRGASASFAIGISAAIVAYILRIFLARYLGANDYGLYSAVITFVLFFMFFRDLGLGQAVTKFIAEFNVHKQYDSIKTIIVATLVLKTISSLFFIALFLLFAHSLATNYFRDPRTVILLQYMVIYVIFSAFFTTAKNIYQGFKKIAIFSSVELVKNILVLLLSLLLFYFGYTLQAPIIAYVITSFLLILFYFLPSLSLARFTSQKTINLKATAKKILLFGMPLFASSFAGKIMGYLDTLVLTYFVSLTEVGIYNVVLPTALILLYGGRSLASVVFPLSSELHTKNDLTSLRKGIELIDKFLFIVLAPILFVLYYYASPLISLFFGAEYISGATSFQILLIGMLIYTPVLVHNSILSGIGKPKYVASITVFSALLNIVLNLFLIPTFSILGAAIATTLSYTCAFIISQYYIKRTIGLAFNFKQFFTQLLQIAGFILAFIALAQLLSFTWWVELIIISTITLSVYLFVLQLLGIISYKQFKQLIKKK